MAYNVYKKVYICHPYAGDPEGNVEKVLEIVKGITEDNPVKAKSNEPFTTQPEYVIPIAVHLLFPKFMSEETFGRDIAMDFCLEVLKDCEEIWVYGPTISAGMRQELSLAALHNITIVWKNFD